FVRAYSTCTMKSAALVLSAALAVSCGGAKPKPPQETPDDSGESGLDTPDTRCIAIGRGERERQRNEPEKIVVKHVLVKFAGAKNASPPITRRLGDACLRALEARKRLQAGEAFADVVAEYSDARGAARREGSSGTIRRSDVLPAFADAAFE